ncbi:MAG: hypothetical protein LW688_12070 [Cryomorphaceae bacterium]|jgi:hypothetical protein|nr:hypothetical protein [Cryomorphaceae bacterium]
MRIVLFVIGCFCFGGGLIYFSICEYALIINDKEFLSDLKKEPLRISMFTFVETVLFFVGAYLVSNNKPEDK